MKRARMMWIGACGAAALTFASAVLWWNATHGDTRQTDRCVFQTVSTVGVATANTDDILLTEQPPYGSVPVSVGQRLVVVLTNVGGGAWAALHVEGSAVTMLGRIGAYDYACRGEPPLAELTILRAETPGVVTLSSSTDAACLHARPGCTIPQRIWRRTITITARSRT
jgi:hypothetical protein